MKSPFFAPGAAFRFSRLTLAMLACCGATLPITSYADTSDRANEDTEVMVVVGKMPEAPLSSATQSISVVDAEALKAGGAKDLASALSMVAGVDIASGGDGGPASSVPALWGLREFDAFLLVVDDVPAGGAFTPALVSLSLQNVERIEVIKGAAPVSYGATSFVGVIHVKHYAAGEGPTKISAAVGTDSSARVAFTTPLSASGDAWQHSVAFDAEKQHLAGTRHGFERLHGLYRGGAELGGGQFNLDLDISSVDQAPGSPHPREGKTLTPRVPLDANHNPRNAKLDEDRQQLSLAYERDTALGRSVSRLAYTRTQNDNARGFLREGFADDGVTVNADGYSQEIERTEIYFDSHFVSKLNPQMTLVWGVDVNHGDGSQHSNNFEYAVAVDGHNAPAWQSLPIDEQTYLDDKRTFSGVYGNLVWDITDRWRIDAGLRFNHTKETRAGHETDFTGQSPEMIVNETVSETDTRFSGALSSSYRLWQSQQDYVTLYGGYRNSFKPAAIDFGPEAETELLKPEDATSLEIGLRGQNYGGALRWDLAAFDMKFNNLVVSQAVNGLPTLINAGDEHFKGIEAEAQWRLNDAFTLLGSYAWHETKFADYERLFDGVPFQLSGNYLEMSPKHLAALGLRYGKSQGLHAHLDVNYVGEVYLNKRNTASATGYTVFDAGVGYTMNNWDVNLDLYNASNERNPSAESELGDAQYYLQPKRSVWLTVNYLFD